jgi:hypothetical protein
MTLPHVNVADAMLLLALCSLVWPAGKMAYYQQRGNGGQPLEGVFYLDGIDAYVKRVQSNSFDRSAKSQSQA